MVDARSGMGMDDFLQEEVRSGRGQWLKNWKKEGSLVVWMHTRSKIYARYAHSFPYIAVTEDKETRKVKRVLRTMKFGCWESEEVLLKRNKRDDLTGERSVSPVICPLCLLEVAIEKNTTLPGDTVIFEVSGRDWEDEPVEVRYRKGNITGEFKKTSKSWRENLNVRKTYLFAVAVDRAPKEGVLIAEESQALGDSVRAVIKHEIDSEGSEKGNPWEHPYAIKWTYNDKAKSPKDYYGAYRYRQAEYTEEIKELIVGTDPPELATYCARGDITSLRAYVEDALTEKAKKVVDLDEVFAVAEAEAAKDEGEPPEKRRPKSKREEPEEEAPRKAGGRRRKIVEKPVDPPGEPCEACGAPMTKTQVECSKCGVQYTLDPEEETEKALPDPDPFNADAEDDDIPF